MPESEEEVLARRARELAKGAGGRRSDPASLEVVEIVIGGETYAVETVFVVEVAPLSRLTLLPGAPEFVMGIVYLRGRVVCANDLAALLGLPRRGLGERDKLVVLGDGEMEIGVVAQSVPGARTLPRASLGTVLPVDRAGRGFIRAVTDEGITVLEAGAILRDPRLQVNQA